MKKFITITMVLFMLTGCDGQISSRITYEDVQRISGLDLICLDGINYYFFSFNSFAVKIDPNTLKPEECQNVQ